MSVGPQPARCVTHPHAHRSPGSGGIATPISQVNSTGLSQSVRSPVSEREIRMWPSPEPPRLIDRLTDRAALGTPGSLIPEQAGRGTLPDFPLPHPPSPSPPSTEPRTDSMYYDWPRAPKAVPVNPPRLQSQHCALPSFLPLFCPRRHRSCSSGRKLHPIINSMNYL